jgi:16S rRNA (uracil1498-N3)-methyltransferase
MAAVLHEEADAAIGRADVPTAGEVVVVVGPEGGIAPEELDALAAAGATAYRMGPTVLRTSTAGTAALAVLLTRSGRWG